MLSSNSLSGTIPSSLFALPSLTQVYLDRNLLNGSLPSTITTSTTLQTVLMTYNHFDLCATPSLSLASSPTCIVEGLCSSCVPSWTHCFPECDTLPAPPIIPVSPPSTPPVHVPAPFVAPSTSTSPPQSPMTGPSFPPPSPLPTTDCLEISPSSCSCDSLPINISVINGSVVAQQPATVDNDAFLVCGNLSASVIIFTNFSQTVVVSGCLNASSIQLNLTQEIVNGLQGASEQDRTKTLVQQGGIGCASISQLPVSIAQPDGCHHVTSTYPPVLDMSTLTIVLQVSSSTANSCQSSFAKIWWVVLLSVVCVVIIASVSAAITWKRMGAALKHRSEKGLRPEHKKSPANAQDQASEAPSFNPDSKMYEPSPYSNASRMYEARRS